MIRNRNAYSASRFSQKPIWHWTSLVRGLPNARASDLDLCISCSGRHLIVEHKTIGAPMSRQQILLLESLAHKPNTDVLLIGTKQKAQLDLFDPSSIAVCCWTFIGSGWRSQTNTTWGTEHQLRKVFEAWVDNARASAASNDAVFTTEPLAA